MNICEECAITPIRGCPTEGCWSLNEVYDLETGNMLVGNEEDMKRSARRILGENGKPVKLWKNTNCVQKRIICYHKCFNFLYGVGKRGIRVKLPSCLVALIKIKHPGGPEEENEHLIDSMDFSN